jgi:multidrug resistance efflux pump
MASPFKHTMRSLEKHGVSRVAPRFFLAMIVLVAWALWMTRARVAVYASTPSGRLEVSRMVHRVAAQEAGRVTAVHLELGRTVEADEVILELDTSVEKKRLDEALTAEAILAPKFDALRKQLTIEHEARALQAKLNGVSVDRARVDLREAELFAAHQEELSAISQRLHDEKLASLIENINAKNDAADRRLKAHGARVDVGKLAVSKKFDDVRYMAQIAELERQLSELEGQAAAARAAASTARAQIERRVVRAPVAGKLGNIHALQVGDVLDAGDVVATIVPSDDIHVVAEFPPADAAGRIHPGQPARVRLNGFSWTQFGMIQADVTSVASEPRDGTIRVELVIRAERNPTIPIQHGLPGSVEVEVERVSPWALLLRGLGSSLAGAPSPPAADAKAEGPK